MNASDKKTIVLATESFYPIVSGVAVVVERLANFLVANGYTVVVLMPNKTHELVTEERNGYLVCRIPSWPMPFRKGLRSTIFPDPTVKALLTKIKPDLIHIHDPALLSGAAVRYARRRGIPVLATCHFTFDMLLTYLPPQVAYLVQRANFRLYKSCNLLTAPTKTLKRELVEAGLTGVPIEVASNGVDFERFAKKKATKELRAQLKIPDGVPVCGYVGSMNPEKNVDVLIRACKILKQRNVDFRCVLMGGGHSKEEWQELVDELGVKDRIIWTKKVEHESDRLTEMVQLLDIFCIPSTIETESIITLEAMAADKPILAAKAKALRELVEDDVNGFLLDPDDVEDWANAMQKLLENPKERRRMGQESSVRAERRDITISLTNFHTLYRKLLRTR